MGARKTPEGAHHCRDVEPSAQGESDTLGDKPPVKALTSARKPGNKARMDWNHAAFSHTQNMLAYKYILSM
jgi:hypothetical protein